MENGISALFMVLGQGVASFKTRIFKLAHELAHELLSIAHERGFIEIRNTPRCWLAPGSAALPRALATCRACRPRPRTSGPSEGSEACHLHGTARPVSPRFERGAARQLAPLPRGSVRTGRLPRRRRSCRRVACRAMWRGGKRPQPKRCAGAAPIRLITLQAQSLPLHGKKPDHAL